MTDIVDILRALRERHSYLDWSEGLSEAADEIERLRDRIEELEAQLLKERNDKADAIHSAAMANIELEMQRVPDGFADIMRAVFAEMDVRDGNRGDAPGHAHEVPGIWDDDNGELAGQPCTWCALWNKAKAMLEAAPQPDVAAEAIAKVVIEDDYWSRGHFYEGRKKTLQLLTTIQDLPVGTVLIPLNSGHYPNEYVWQARAQPAQEKPE